MSERSNRRTVLILAFSGVLMFAFAFAMVPLYRLVCSVIGINDIGSNSGLGEAAKTLSQEIDESRLVTVQFDTTLNGNLAWEFKPEIWQVQVHPGERKVVNFNFRNDAAESVSTQAVPGVTPWQATEYFHKIECFCFNTQTLAAGESVSMPLQFMVDPELPEEIQTLTLSYTMMNLDRTEALKKGEMQVSSLNSVPAKSW